MAVWPQSVNVAVLTIILQAFAQASLHARIRARTVVPKLALLRKATVGVLALLASGGILVLMIYLALNSVPMPV